MQKKLLVSACLAGIPCRMDGQSKGVEAIRHLVLEGQAVPVCPEVLGGLPTPRIPSEQKDGRVVNAAGEDVTDAFVRGAEKALEICRQNGCEAAVLKSKSPSCGKGLIHNGRFDGGLTEGDGICAKMLMENGITVLTEDEFLGL